MNNPKNRVTKFRTKTCSMVGMLPAESLTISCMMLKLRVENSIRMIAVCFFAHGIT